MLNTALMEGHRPLGIAISGGSDSTALLMLAVQALGATYLRAVTVDHGLRHAAGDEARSVGQLCATLGVAHDIIKLDVKAGPDLQARARTARYNALGDWAKSHNIAAIALGHTKDDVAETFLMRLARGSGVDGLAQMPAQFARFGVTFLRPLLGVERIALQGTLRARGIAWCEDPSNADPRFTRVQMRQAQPELDALGLTSERLSQTAAWMRAASDVLENAADTWIDAHAWAEHGDAVFDLAALQKAPQETAARVLSRVLCNISGNPYRPRYSALNALLQSTTAQTLHGCLAYPYRGTLRVTRELNALSSNEARWTVSGPLSAEHHVRPIAAQGLEQIPNWRETALVPRRSLLSTPSIWLGRKLIAAPIAAPHPKWHAIAANPLRLAK